MLHKNKNIFFIILLIFSLNLFAGDKMGKMNWCVYYSDNTPVSELERYDLIVLDSDNYSKLVLDSLIDLDKTVLGYISLGEIESFRSYFEKFKKAGLMLRENQNWKGSYFIDIRNTEWTEFVIYTLIPEILQKGFNGIFMDTLDNPSYLNDKYPKKYNGMKASAIHLVKTIRRNYPDIKIMMNRGYEILSEVVHDIDFELGECVYSDYDFKTKKYKINSKEDFLNQVEILKNAQKMNPKLEIFTLDYWYENDAAEIKRIYKIEREHDFIPYVATIELDKIIHEPVK